jgi:uncharacterized protein (DUF1697 family)
MAVLIVFLRGVNVGGNRKLKMAELKSICESLGFTDVHTYLQSGNVVLRSRSASGVGAKIEQGLRSSAEMDVKVIVRTPAELRAVIDATPFDDGSDRDPSRTVVAFLDGVPAPEKLDALEKLRRPDEELHPRGREIYAHFPSGINDSKLAAALTDKKLGTACTVRNWNTVLALMEISAAM